MRVDSARTTTPTSPNPSSDGYLVQTEFGAGAGAERGADLTLGALVSRGCVRDETGKDVSVIASIHACVQMIAFDSEKHYLYFPLKL